MEKIPNGRYSKEFRDGAVRMAIDEGLSAGEVSQRLSIPKTTVVSWVRAFRNGKLGEIGKNTRQLSEIELELARVKRELAETRMERDILKKGRGVLCEGVAVRYAVISAMRLEFPITVLCRVLKVSRSGYYASQARSPSVWSKTEQRLEAEIKAAHVRMRETCGPERLQWDLASHGIVVGVHRIKRIRKKLGLRCKQKRKFRCTTDSRHNLPVAPNRLDQEFFMASPNQAWVSDITYIPTAEGWLYLAGHKDLCTGEIVGYAMSERITTNLIRQSLLRAVERKRPGKGLIHHSDRGSQYCSRDYRRLIASFGMVTSMSRRGNCYDNAPMESFWGALKSELIYHRRYTSREEARREITEYIEIFYNRQRRQARLGFLSPAAFEQWFWIDRQAA
ncbi:MAG: IS3 family transposase [Candidatus Ozemobacteraceae bacterium]